MRVTEQVFLVFFLTVSSAGCNNFSPVLDDCKQFVRQMNDPQRVEELAALSRAEGFDAGRAPRRVRDAYSHEHLASLKKRLKSLSTPHLELEKTRLAYLSHMERLEQDVDAGTVKDFQRTFARLEATYFGRINDICMKSR